MEADLLDEESMMKAIEGSDFVAHIASPFFVGKPKHEDELIKPAVNGTISALKACTTSGVKRIVITSSLISVGCQKPDGYPEDMVFRDTHWTDVTSEGGGQPYAKSKTLAEKAAWDYLKLLPEDKRVELVTINPGFIIGPSLCGPGFESGKIVGDLVLGKAPGVPRVKLSSVDVREVAEAHMKALEVPEAAG